MGENDRYVHAAFGDTNRADSVPDHLVAHAGPVYLEGRLVLSLSFQKVNSGKLSSADAEDVIERYRLWDDLAEAWYGDLEVLRCEQVDRVVRHGSDTAVLWEGALDTRARVVPVPDLDEAGMAANRELDLCWKRV